MNSNSDVNFVDLKKIGIMRSTANLVNIILGSGVLYIPKALSQSGFYFGVFLLVLVSAMSAYISVELVKIAKKEKVNEYETLAERAGGTWLFYLTSVFCFLYSFGALMNYSELIKSSIESILENYWTTTQLKQHWVSIGITLALFSLVVTPLSLLRQLSMLSWTSILSVSTFCLLAIGVIIAGVRTFSQVFKFMQSSRLFQQTLVFLES
ncbi:hypothetical protein MHBO_000536 [Bonamia ostreae]|uniref:Amino acid transporter transmembrane domain-containing protein n=2 Tax=Bonamia ostreae TaxID=126728 RepID=A0ABV2AFY8_9EUKA